MNLHLLACLKLSGRIDVQYLDPLLARSWLRNGFVECVVEWVQQFPTMSCIVTVVHVNDHWTPVVWTAGLCEVQVSMWEHFALMATSRYHLVASIGFRLSDAQGQV